MRLLLPVRAAVLCKTAFRRGGAREGFVVEEARCAEFSAGNEGGGMMSMSSESVNDGMFVEGFVGFAFGVVWSAFSLVPGEGRAGGGTDFVNAGGGMEFLS